MDYDFGYDFSEIGACTEFSEMDETVFDYLDKDVDEYYEICNRHYENGLIN